MFLIPGLTFNCTELKGGWQSIVSRYPETEPAAGLDFLCTPPVDHSDHLNQSDPRNPLVAPLVRLGGITRLLAWQRLCLPLRSQVTDPLIKCHLPTAGEYNFLRLDFPTSGCSGWRWAVSVFSAHSITESITNGLFQLTCLFRAPRRRRFFAGSEHSELTAAVAKSSLGTYQMTSGGLGVPRPTCTLFSGDRSSISEEAWEEMKQNKCPVRKSWRTQLQENGTRGPWGDYEKSPQGSQQKKTKQVMI